MYIFANFRNYSHIHKIRRIMNITSTAQLFIQIPFNLKISVQIINTN